MMLNGPLQLAYALATGAVETDNLSAGQVTGSEQA